MQFLIQQSFLKLKSYILILSLFLIHFTSTQLKANADLNTENLNQLYESHKNDHIDKNNNLCPKYLKNKKSNLLIVKSSSNLKELSLLPQSTQKLLQEKVLGNLSLAVLLKNNKPIAYGTENIIQNTKENIDEYKDLILKATGAQDFDEKLIHQDKNENVFLQVTPFIIGSSITSHFFNDLDLEAFLIFSYKNFSLNDFHNKNSLAIYSTKKFLQEYLIEMKKSGLIFSDFKAGELEKAPQELNKTKSKAIKWSFDEVLKGEKWITNESGEKKLITLEEALSQEARIKVDWYKKIQLSSEVEKLTGLKEKYVEISCLFTLGGNRPYSPTVLKISKENNIPEKGATGAHLALENFSSKKPFTLNSLFFREKDLKIAVDLSKILPQIDISYFNAITVLSLKTYFQNGDYLKILKRLQNRLYYWNDLNVFSESYKISPPLTIITLYNMIDKIIKTNNVLMLSQYKSALESLINLEKLNIDVSKDLEELKFLISEKIKESEIKFLNHEDLKNLIEKKLQVEVKKEIEQNIVLKQYIEFVLNQEKNMNLEPKTTNPVFTALIPNQNFINSYKEIYQKLKNINPEINFTHPEDLHITLSYHGKITNSQLQALKNEVSKANNLYKNQTIKLINPRFEFLGSNSKVLAITFSVDLKNSSTYKNLFLDKTKFLALTNTKDNYPDTLLLHITLARIKSNNPDTKLALIELLDNFELSKLIQEQDINLEIKLLNTIQNQNPDFPKYKEITD
jgi:2'-5' RNA ligase